MVKGYIADFIQGIFLIAATPLFMGFVKSIKANIRGYKGPGILQVYFDLAKLFSKGRVISKSSSFITQIGPSLTLAASITAAFLVPTAFINLRSGVGNIFIIVFLLGIIKFLNSLMGLDCASTFGGMGASRELFISMFSEPIVFILVTFLYFETKNFNINRIAYLNMNIGRMGIGHIIAAAAFFILILVENARMPADNPETHLELTMIHEAMILDISGRDLAFVELASGLKLMVFIALFINGFIPVGSTIILSSALIAKAVIAYAFKLIICLIGISIIETMMAKFRLFRIPELTAAAFSISIVAITINYFI